MQPLVVGFDLDMTLIDTAPGFEATLDALGAEYGVSFPSREMTERLGPPLDQLLVGHLDEQVIPAAVDRFRALYPDLAIVPTPALPGAHDALAAVRAHGGDLLLVTGKFTRNAHLHVDHVGFDVDHVAGEVWGVGKAAVLQARGAQIYVGDHIHDVEGALAAGATSVSVLTGGCTREELLAAGTHVVLDDLSQFPAWLDEWVLEQRIAALEASLRSHGSMLVAFSGGADSAFLLAAAARTLGADRVIAATAYSDSLPQAERDPARDFAASLGVRLLTPATHEMEREGYRANEPDRCFFCKAELLDTLVPLAQEHGIAVVATGTNADDARAGFRPGIKAADERGAVTPLLDAGFSKAQVRAASRLWDLPTWDKPAAACLSSRIAYGIEVTPHRLARVERAEAGVRRVLAEAEIPLRDLRVRDIGDLGRIELDRAALSLAQARSDLAERLLSELAEAGFSGAELDPLGFRSGAMNEGVDPSWR